YGRAKGKIVLEKGKIKDTKEALGEYVYATLKAGGIPDTVKMQEFCADIDACQAEIDRLEAEAKQSGQDISGAFRE
ncbi:MAG: hypothetical protein IJ443_05430, partial [Firmicutes bacterium]|nr:hypothetical protein [Bacillota bacterium]